VHVSCAPRCLPHKFMSSFMIPILEKQYISFFFFPFSSH
jgi:hypothetical protein